MKSLITKIIATIAITVFAVSPINVYAEDSESLQEKIDKINEQYLKDHDLSSLDQLSYEQEKELIKQIEIVKDNDPTIIEAKEKGKQKISIARTAGYYDDTGNILVTGDESTFGWSHGHAGICASEKDAVIEAMNPSDGIRYLRNRITSYWKNKSASMMGVVNASYNDYHVAYKYAYAKVDTGYDFLSWTPEMYCSELVFRAWENAGHTLYNHSVGYILPYQIYVSANTYTLESWNGGY